MEVILFDWGGTLAMVDRQADALRRGSMEAAGIVAGPNDSEAATRLLAAFFSAEAEAGADLVHREVDMWAVLARWASSTGRPVDAHRLAAAGQALGRAWTGSLDRVPGALEAVRWLRDRGYRLGLVSNCSIAPDYCHQELARQGFAGLLDLVVFSSEVGYRKPAAAIYEEAIRRAYPAGRPADLSRVLFVGDSPALDVIAPAGMGMKTALVVREPGIWPEADYARARPNLRINAVTELPALLDRAGPDPGG